MFAIQSDPRHGANGAKGTDPRNSRFTLRLVSGLAVATAGALFLVVGASGEGHPTPSQSPAGNPAVSTEVATLEECIKQGGCSFLNGLANSSGADAAVNLQTAEAAMKQIRPPGACPRLAQMHADAGVPIAGVIGPCPTQLNETDAESAAATLRHTGVTTGVSR